jgi:hypothetical protein
VSLFDLLFLALALTAAIAICAAAGLALSHRGAQSLHILRRLAIGALLYFTVVITVSLVGERRMLKLGDVQCFDDWCVAAKSATRGSSSYLIGLQISSRARRISQRERNIAVYLIDPERHRYDSPPSKADDPIHTLLQPGQSIDFTREIPLPAAARDLSLVVAHQGGFPIGWFIVGYDTWFRKPPLIRLD